MGLGYVGLPLMLRLRGAGFRCIGVDIDVERVERLRRGESYVTDVADEDLAALATGTVLDASPAAEAYDAAIICVPTPLTNQQPDLGPIEAAARAVGETLRPGTLVVLESTTYPGTTEEFVQPILEETSGMKAGGDFALVFSPERIDPGREPEHLAKTPRIVGGLTRSCAALATELYSSFIYDVRTVSSPREAEMAKLIENSFRYVNIALINELAMLSRDLGVDIWESIQAAATKPFGFMPFWPGPGVGGHCIAIDPSYLSWSVAQHVGHRVTFLEYAQTVNARMPAYVARRVAEALNDRAMPIRGASILAIGVSYKPDVGDVRESPTLPVLELLKAAGARISYHDPFVPTLEVGGRLRRSTPLTDRALEEHDLALILTAHSQIDFERVVDRARLVFDTRGVTRGMRHDNLIRL
ncbi:MAG TPA: nucleotide sugar dehydrogenase [Actinomycetota bacterium]|nr:nucleotide sugar dehydrogenase [Actinomycetota bacterium]